MASAIEADPLRYYVPMFMDLLEDKRRPTLLQRLGRVKVRTYVVIFAVWAGLVIGVARYLIHGESVWAVVLIAFGPAIPLFFILVVLDWRGHFDT